MGVDPLAMQYAGWSTYNYTMANPVMLVDPSGMGPEDWVYLPGGGENGSSSYVYDSRVTDQASAEKYYGANAQRTEYGYTYEANTKAIIQLLQGGEYKRNGKSYPSKDYGISAEAVPQSSDILLQSTAGTIGNQSTMGGFNFDGGGANWSAPISKEAAARYEMYNKLVLFEFAQIPALFGAGGAISTAPAWLPWTSNVALPWLGNQARHYGMSYIRNFMNGGARSMGMELVNQTTTQIVQGDWSLGNYDLIGLGTSSTLGGEYGGVQWQMLQGASGSAISYSYNEGFEGFLVKNKSAAWITGTTVNGVLSPLMGRAPLIKGSGGEVMNEIISGYVQGIIEVGEDETNK